MELLFGDGGAARPEHGDDVTFVETTRDLDVGAVGAADLDGDVGDLTVGFKSAHQRVGAGLTDRVAGQVQDVGRFAQRQRQQGGHADLELAGGGGQVDSDWEGGGFATVERAAHTTDVHDRPARGQTRNVRECDVDLLIG